MQIPKPIIIIALLVAAGALVFFFIIPKYQESQVLQASVLEREAEYNRQSEYYAKVFTLLKNIKDRKDTLEKVDTALPPKVAFAPLVYFLQKRADENKLAIQSLVFSQVPPETNALELPTEAEQEVKDLIFTLSISGGYQNLKNFLLTLEQSARLFQINSITFVALLQQSQNSLPIYNFNLDIQTHYY